ncbi:MAG: VOC family protein [Spirochaetes bacterium]|nr:VOC family protein [Spirochaetota bacterium]
MIVIESINHIGITVSDLDRSIKFYRDLFDFETIEKLSGSGVAYIRVADMVIGLYESSGYKGSEESRNKISFFVDEEDFDDAVEELKNMDVTIVHGPENLRNGQSVIFLDPDGNQIELSYPKID